MASAMIHIAVAKEIGKKIGKDSYEYYLGSIAPDLAKEVGLRKAESHFQLNSAKPDVPKIEEFLDKYRNEIYDDFTLGYFIHLYTDKLWFDGFLDELVSGNCIKLMDGTIIHVDDSEVVKLIYEDYTNLNIQLVDDYNLELSLFYNDFYIPRTKINEIPIQKLDVLIDKLGVILKNSEEEKNYIFDMYMVNDFIKKSTNEICDFIVQEKLV